MEDLAAEEEAGSSVSLDTLAFTLLLLPRAPIVSSRRGSISSYFRFNLAEAAAKAPDPCTTGLADAEDDEERAGAGELGFIVLVGSTALERVVRVCCFGCFCC